MSYFVRNIPIVMSNTWNIIKKDLLKTPIINYFGTNYNQNVLITYITYPFKKGSHIRHTNSVEAIEIARVFDKLKYNVDIADYDYEGYLDYNKYELIFGFGEPLVKSFYQNNKSPIRIFYGTGRHHVHQNQDSLKRIKEVAEQKGKWLLESARLAEKTWTPATTLVDAIVTLGNEDARNSYGQFYDGDIYSLEPSIFILHDCSEIIKKKNYDEARKNFLWFGSSGMIHKGLDLLLEYFSKNRQINLHICGPLEDEPEFKKAYQKEISNMENIFVYGFVEMNTALFKSLIEKCAFVIYPTSSEGGSPSVLNVSGNGGLIPIVTKEATIDIDDFGILMEAPNISSVELAINKALKLSPVEMRHLSNKCGKAISERHSLNAFANNFKNIIQIILSDKNKL